MNRKRLTALLLVAGLSISQVMMVSATDQSQESVSPTAEQGEAGAVQKIRQILPIKIMVRIPIQEMKIQIRTVLGIRAEKTVVREMKEKIRNRVMALPTARTQVMEIPMARTQAMEIPTAKTQAMVTVTEKIQAMEMMTEKTRFLRGLGFCQEIVGGISAATVHIQRMESII